MAYILAIETSTKVCSVALLAHGDPLFERIQTEGASHASLLGRYVWEAMEYVRNKGLKLDAVAVSSGPGSYTGLRIGVSEAKGLCYGLEIPLISIPSLKVLASSEIEGKKDRNEINEVYLCPMIDARRMEVYSAIYDLNLNEVRSVQADIVEDDTYDIYLENHKVLFFGDGSEKCKSVIVSPNAVFVDHVFPKASAMGALAEKAYLANDFVDIAYFEPFYLKEFQATTPKNKVIDIAPKS